LTVAQVVVMSALALSRQGGPSDALVLGNGRLEFIAVMCGGGLAALALALAISASVRSTDQALAMLPVVLIGLMIFAIPAVASSPVTRQLSYAASSQWAMRAAASTADLNRLELVSTLIPEVGTPDQALIDDLTMAFLEPDSRRSTFRSRSGDVVVGNGRPRCHRYGRPCRCVRILEKMKLDD